MFLPLKETVSPESETSDQRAGDRPRDAIYAMRAFAKEYYRREWEREQKFQRALEQNVDTKNSITRDQSGVVALATAICVVRWSKLESAIFPYAIALKTTPVVAFAPILLIWFGYGFASKSIAAAAVCFFPVLINGVHGLRAVEMAYLDLFHTWNASWLQSLRFLRLPTSLPYLFAAMKLSSSLAVVGAIVAEFVAADKGLGFLIVVYSRRLDTPEMFATIVLSTLFGVGWFYGIVVLERMAATRYKFLVQAGEFF